MSVWNSRLISIVHSVSLGAQRLPQSTLDPPEAPVFSAAAFWLGRAPIGPSRKVQGRQGFNHPHWNRRGKLVSNYPAVPLGVIAHYLRVMSVMPQRFDHYWRSLPWEMPLFVSRTNFGHQPARGGPADADDPGVGFGSRPRCNGRQLRRRFWVPFRKLCRYSRSWLFHFS